MSNSDAATLFCNLFHRHYAELLVYVRGIAGEVYAEDIVADVFTSLWHSGKVTDLRNARALLYRAALSRSLNVLRHRRVSERHIRLIQSVNMRALAVDERAEAELMEDELQRMARIEKAISRLPDRCRQVLQMSYLQCMKSKDIADVMKLSVRTVEAHLYRGLKLLREQLGAELCIMMQIFIELIK